MMSSLLSSYTDEKNQHKEKLVVALRNWQLQHSRSTTAANGNTPDFTLTGDHLEGRERNVLENEIVRLHPTKIP